MSGSWVFAGLVFSLASLTYLASTDPKRRRSHGQKVLERPSLLWPARIVLWGPGMLLIGLGNWSGLVIWAGALTTLGWVLVAISPAAYAQLRKDIQRIRIQVWEQLGRRAQSLLETQARYVPERLRAWSLKIPRVRLSAAERTQSAVVEELNARITALEARLNRLERGEEPMTPMARESEGGKLTTKQAAE